MSHVPRISAAEWQVMKVIWKKAPITGNEVVEALSSTKWSPKTIRTLINRLVRKKALGFEKEGRIYRYFPLVEEADCIRTERRSFLNRVYGGALMPMLASILEEEDLSDEEIEEIKQILDEKGK